jgi:NADH-quinone oxidoreductase subunit L
MPEYSGPATAVELAKIPLWLIALAPFVGAAINALFGRRLQASGWQAAFGKRHHIGSPAVSAVAVGSMALSLLLTVAAVLELAALEPRRRTIVSHAWQMVRIGSLDVSFSFALDPLSAVMTLIITFVGGLIHVYATSYMAKDEAYWRFFSYLNLFVFSMLLLVLGDNFIVMFFGWEGVGLCSYLLIGFWYRDYQKASAGMKAFVVNRIGDFGFVCGMALLFWGLGGAWIGESGDYVADYRARFIAVDVEMPGADAHAPAATPPAALRPAGATALLTMTAYAGARVYLGVQSHEQLARAALPDCRTRPAWSASEGVQIAHDCYAVAPFVRKRVPAGVATLVVVPGDGAVVSGDGFEAAVVRTRLDPGGETLLAPVGPTLTFREIHDQLAVSEVHRDERGSAKKGATPFAAALEHKSVWGIALVTLACICFFIGATGKSAQIPLFVWLPDAMAGPTPVSALIHAATMVTAGVYMVARLNFLYALTPVACGVVALTGALTALFAATMGFFQYDIKKVLAYSTVSQLGFMFIGVGVGAYWAGIFHLMTHAFFKACLFLGSGSVIHGMHAVVHNEAGAQDMRNMGGLRAVMPTTARTYYVACLAITAAPIPFLAGFWSKDEILWKAFNTQQTAGVPGLLIYGIGLVAALGTSFYMWRSYFLTFEGKHAKRAIRDQVKESPSAITGVLVVLAALSAVSGVVFGFSSHFLGGHGEPLLEHWLAPVLGHAPVRIGDAGLRVEYVLMAISVAAALGAYGMAVLRYGASRPTDWEARERALPFFRLLHDKYYVDEIYQATVVRPVLRLRVLLSEMDRWIVDGLVNASAVAGRAVSWAVGAHDKHVVDGLVNLVADGTLQAGQRLRTVQTGRVQTYVYGILGGLAFFAIIQYLLR